MAEMDTTSEISTDTSAHFPDHPTEISLFDKDITPLPHPTLPSTYLIRFNPRWRNGNGNPLGGLYLPIVMSAGVQEMKAQGQDYDVPVSNYMQYAKSASRESGTSRWKGMNLTIS
jgi:hypothetical protein